MIGPLPLIIRLIAMADVEALVYGIDSKVTDLNLSQGKFFKVVEDFDAFTPETICIIQFGDLFYLLQHSGQGVSMAEIFDTDKETTKVLVEALTDL